jgi:hypothetical protein
MKCSTFDLLRTLHITAICNSHWRKLLHNITLQWDLVLTTFRQLPPHQPNRQLQHISQDPLHFKLSSTIVINRCISYQSLQQHSSRFKYAMMLIPIEIQMYSNSFICEVIYTWSLCNRLMFINTKKCYTNS